MKNFIFFILFFISTFLYAEDSGAKQLANQAKASNQAGEGLNQQVLGEIGFSQIDGDGYLKLSIGYEFTMGIMGLGVMAPINFLVTCNDENGCDDKTWNKIRKEDWDEFSDWLTLVRYFRYGWKFDESNMFYARFGDLGSAYIGHSTIVSSYLNSISWDEFKPGLQFDVYTPWGGIETIMDDIISPGLMGTRLYVRPTTFFLGHDNYYSNFAIGTSFIGDRKAKSKVESTDSDGNLVITSKNESLFFYGFDLEFRVFRNKYVTVTPYTDFNFISDFGHGYHFGIDNKLHIPLTGALFSFKPEYRILGDQYMPGYFDSMYMVTNELYKYDLLEKQKAKNGYYIELGYEQYFLNSILFNIKGSYEDYQGKNNSAVLLQGSVPILESFNFSAIYSKVAFNNFSDAFDLKNALLIVEASVAIYGPMKVRIQYERTWYEDKDGNLDYDSSWSFGTYVAFTF